MHIQVKIAGSIANKIGANTINCNATNISELKSEIKLNYPEIGKLKYQVFVNNKLTKNATISNTDVILLFSPYMGG